MESNWVETIMKPTPVCGVCLKNPAEWDMTVCQSCLDSYRRLYPKPKQKEGEIMTAPVPEKKIEKVAKQLLDYIKRGYSFQLDYNANAEKPRVTVYSERDRGPAVTADTVLECLAGIVEQMEESKRP